LKPAVEKVEKAVAEYERLTEETVSTNQKMDEQRHQLDAAAKQYMDNCTILLTGQNQKIIAEIQAGKEVSALTERLEKITLINDIIDTGNLTRIAAWRSQAAREPKIIQDANANFEIMQDKFSAMRRIIRSPEDIKNLNNVEEAAKEYKTAMNGFLALWLNNEELAKKRTEVGNIVTAESMKYPSPAWTAPPESPQKRSNR
jgi:methyl-accepting chemotaxis protein